VSSTNRGLYSLATSRFLYSPAAGRGLYSGFGFISPSAGSGFYGYDSIYGSGAWTASNYSIVQSAAASALSADTSLGTAGFPYLTGVFLTADTEYSYYGCWVDANYQFWRSTFSLPAGRRGSISTVKLYCSAGGMKGWNGSNNSAYQNVAYLDFGISLRLFFSDSATAFGSGGALLGGTPDAVVSLSTINAAQVSAGHSITSSGSNNAPPGVSFGYVTLDISAAASKLNSLSSDTIYMWSAISLPAFPYLYDNPGTSGHDFGCWAQFRGDAKLGV